jgi:Ca2+-transporting ATPase
LSNAGPFHAESIEQVAAQLGTDPARGLTTDLAAARFIEFGPNALQRVGVRTWPKVLLSQFTDFLILILLVAVVVSITIGQVGDAITILAVVVLNGLLGFVQEWRAERSLEALQSMLALKTRIVREGREQVIDATQLVPGDVVLLKSGDKVPADMRLIEAVNLRADESALTGESIPIQKETRPVAEDTDLAARSSMAWMGAAIVNGYGRGLVIATAMQTEFGRIAELTQSIGDTRTPLQKRLVSLGKNLGLISIALSFAVALLGWVFGRPVLDMFFTGVALAVAIVPEALPIVLTTTLALGIRAMVKKNALFRDLRSAETLGSASVICSDKTGTITTNEMTVTNIWMLSGMVDVTGEGYDPAGHFEVDGQQIDHRERADLNALLTSALICNHADIAESGGVWKHSGQPTEAALVVAACKAMLAPPQDLETVSELSFNSDRKRMTIIARDPAAADDGLSAHVKGAPEILLSLCSHARDGDQIVELDAAGRERIEAAYAGMAGDGLRVIGIATRQLPADASLQEDDVERGLVFLGLTGIMDPPRPEVAHAIEVAKEAGIRVIIITGDAAPTALAVAERIGLDVASALTGEQVAAMTDAELLQALEMDVLFARTAPKHKLRIVGLLQDQGQIVAMTGDGVNDAPALKKADIGVAMGIRGTDVARSAADLILLDDNFRSIVAAVDEGRRQFDNIRKFVRYILSAALGEVAAIFLNIMIGGPLILLPVQILWMNLVTDGMTAIALGVEPGESDRMQRPPRDPEMSLPNRQGVWMIIGAGSYIAVATAALFYFYLGDGTAADIARAQTVAFTAIIVMEKVNVFNFRVLDRPLNTVGWFSNRWLLLAIAITLGAHICAVYVPFLQRALHTVPLGFEDWTVMALVALPLFAIMETAKWVAARSGPAQGTDG